MQLFEQTKATWGDWVVMITFAILMFATFDIRIALPITLGMALIVSLVDYYAKKTFDKEKGKRYAKIMMCIVFILVIMDTFSTYYAVHWTGIGYERNKLVLYLWDTFGVVGGELIRFGLIGLLFTFNHFDLKSKNNKRFLVGVFMPIFYLLLWGFVVSNNLFYIIQSFIS